MNIFRRNPQNEDMRTPNDPPYIISVRKVKRSAIISYLRDMPLQGRVYLLWSEGQVQDRYTSKTSLGTLDLLFGNYMVYEIDVSQRQFVFEFDKVPMAGPASNTVDISIDLSVAVQGADQGDSWGAEQLFRSQIRDISPEIERRVKREVRKICREFRPQDVKDTETKIQQILLDMDFDFGMVIVDALVELVLPVMVEQTIDAREFRAIENWVRGDTEYATEFQFGDAPYPYEVQVKIGLILDDSKNATELLRRYDIKSPEAEVEKRTIADVRSILQRYNSFLIPDAEAEVRRHLEQITFEFGVKVTYVQVQIAPTEKVLEAQSINRTRDLIEEALDKGLRGVLVEVAANPDVAPKLLDMINRMQEEEIRMRGVVNDERQRQLENLSKAIEMGIVDPDLIQGDVTDDVRQATRTIFNSPQLSSTNAPVLPASQSAGALEAGDVKEVEPVIQPETGDVRYDMGHALDDLPPSSYDEVDNGDEDDDDGPDTEQFVRQPYEET